MEAPATVDELRAHLDRALGLMLDMSDDYTKAQEFYDGTRAEVADSRAVRTIIDQTKRAPLSFAHIPVDTIADKVELSSITADGSAKTYLDTWLDANDIDSESAEWILKACMFGDYYVVTDPVGLDLDGVTAIEDIESVGMSPLSTIVVYDRKTGRRKEYGAHFWNAGTKLKPTTKAMLYYDDCSVKLIAVGHDNTTAKEFDLDIPVEGPTGDPGEDIDAYLFHDGERMLIAHLAIGSKPYGTPIHRKAYGPQEAITKISANNLTNVDALGLPSRWALVDPAAEIDDDIDDDFGTDSPATTDPTKKDGRTEATTGRRTRAVPGVVEYLRGVKQTGTYEGSQSDPFLAALDWYVRAMAVITGIALFEFDLNGEQPSGEARRRAEGRANRKAAAVKRQAGAFFRDIADTVLALVNVRAEVTVTFNPSETSTDKEGLELVALKVKAGVPLRQALLEAGYTDERVGQWYPAGKAALSPDLVTMLADALAKLGNAKTLGVVGDDAIAAMIPQLFDYVETLADEGVVVATIEPDGGDLITDPATQLKAKADALGILIRAGADPEESARRAGLEGLTFPNVPVTVRLPEAAAAGLEGAVAAPTGP